MASRQARLKLKPPPDPSGRHQDSAIALILKRSCSIGWRVPCGGRRQGLRARSPSSFGNDLRRRLYPTAGPDGSRCQSALASPRGGSAGQEERLYKGVSRSMSKVLVRAAGIEPALCRQNWILSPARLPVPPRPHEAASSSHSSCGAILLRLSIAPICHNPEHQVQRRPADSTLEDDPKKSAVDSKSKCNAIGQRCDGTSL